MTNEQTIALLKRVRDDLRSVRDDTDSPAIESCVREMEVQCHMALAYLGIVESIFPDVAD